MENSSTSLRADEKVKKVYISDSPVAEDNIEYNYVSSDIEEEFDNSDQIIEPNIMPPEPDMTEVDELAKEAEYQRDLQDRLQRATLNEADTSESSMSSYKESNSDVENSPTSDSESTVSQVSKTSTSSGNLYKSSASSNTSASSKSSQSAKSSKLSHSHSGSGESEDRTSPLEPEQTDKSSTGEISSEILPEWKNPPANPFQNQSLKTNTQHGAIAQTYGEGSKPVAVATSPPVVPPLTPSNADTLSDQHQSDTGQPEKQLEPMNVVEHAVPGPIGQLAQQPPPNQQQIPVQNQQQPAYQQYNYQNTGSYEEGDPYTAQQRQAELEQLQYQQLQQQQLQQQQLFAQQQLLLQQQRLQQSKQQPSESPLVSRGVMMQRNAPVMYMNNPENHNEYYAVTPRDSYHPYSGTYEQFTNDQQSEGSLMSEHDEVKGNDPRAIVAPKPVRPTKDYVTKNKFRAAGQHSAKPGYSERLIQKREEQEQLKHWAPGMVIPRKKAASADDIIKKSEQDELASAEDAWSKRAQDLAAAKQARIAGSNKGKKRSSKISNLKRFPSDNSLSKKGGTKVPPIAAAGRPEPQGYLASYQTAQGWSASDRDYSLPGQPNGHMTLSNAASPPAAYGKSGVQLSQSYPQSNIPTHPPVHQHYGQGLPAYASPIYGEAAYNSQYQNYEPHQQRAGPPSGGQFQGPPPGGYHQSPMLGGYQNGPPSSNFHPGPLPGNYQPGHQPSGYYGPPSGSQYSGPPSGSYHSGPPSGSYHAGPPSGGYHHQPRQDIHSQHPEYPHPPGQAAHSKVPYGSTVNQQQHHQPAYNYSGYLNSAEQYNEPSVKDYEMKPYDGSPYSSPHPPYQTSNYVPEVTKKVVLNPYSMVPPIPDKLSETYSTGSYVLAYQKEKEKAEKHAKGPTYKVYTMKDYKNLKLEYKLGGLGPSQNPELVKEKVDIRNKQLQYGKEVMDQEKKKPHPSPRKPNPSEDVQLISGRQLAVEYAKHIPKPKVAPPFKSQPKTMSNDLDKQQDNLANSGKVPAMQPCETPKHSTSRATPQTRQIDLVELEDLQRRHEEDQRAVADIQYKLQQAA